jgi:class 3 adenylate cyclase/tetratricopeptide (TPR) repeat protein
MQCPACSHENLPGQKFCGECGGRLTAAPRPPALERFASPASYTPKHLAEKILTSRGVIEGERKQVTVMFTDVSGFTAMSERIDAEEMHAIMDRAFEVILAAVHRYEGTINQFLGDGVMALFGAPVAHEDHANRALSAALIINRNLGPLREDIKRIYGRDFQMRIGINTGPVVVGAIGRDLRMDYTAVGDTTNLAARLLNVAKPGQIVVSRYTQHLRDGFYLFDDLGEFEVKGKTHPVRAYALLNEVRGQTRLDTSRARGLSPLVGRDAELVLLQDAWRSTKGGDGGALLITGEPGLGKSRLLYEFARSLEPAELIEAPCLSYGTSMPYHPVVDALRRLFEISDGLDAGAIDDALGRQLARLQVDDPGALESLKEFMGVAAPGATVVRLSPAQLKEQMLRVVRSIFLKAARQRPRVLVFENLHWVDASSAEFLRLLAQDVAAQPLLLVLTTRPSANAGELPGTRWSLELTGLEERDRRRMIFDLLQTEAASPELMALILSRAEGNPLYVEEIVRQLRETDGIVVEDGRATLRTHDLHVPATIHDIIAARVDRLAEELKAVLQGAAVVGRQFAVALVARILELNADLFERLDRLSALEFVFPDFVEPDPTYRFKHALTQDVVYEGLLVRRRRQYHGAAGAWLEEAFASRLNEVAELLAYHFARSDDLDKAVDYAIMAGEKAQRRWASPEALAHFASALAILEARPDTQVNRLRRIDAVLKQAEVNFALGRHAEQLKSLDAIGPLVSESADPPREAAWRYWSGFLHSLTGSPPQLAIRYCEQAAAIAESCHLSDLRAYAESCLAQAYLVAGALREAREVGARALATFEAQGNVWWASRTLIHLAPTANALGQWDESLAHCRRLLDHGLAVDDLRLKAAGWWRTASAHLHRGAPQDALRCCDEALKLQPPPFDTTMVKAMQGYALAKTGRASAGIPMLQDAIAWLHGSNLRYTYSVIALWLADVYVRVGDAPRGRVLADEVLAMARSIGYRHLEGVASRTVGESLLVDDPETARQHLAEAQVILVEVGAPNDLAKTFLARALLERRLHADDPAAHFAREAAAIFSALDTVDGPAQAQAILDTHPGER